jgi:hypothetical protein
MTVSLNVLRHLGLNLYSNVPAVLSEAVANAWDADARNVRIDLDIDEQEITITDDGHGMSQQDVNERYLYVGYQRREDDERPDTTRKYNRPVMGRKGIGKLSLFSIANVVEVYTTDGEDKNAFRMVVDDMKEKMEKEGAGSGQATYVPEELDDFPSDLERGTKVVLKDLKKRIRTNLTSQYLKKRLARRFGTFGQEYEFNMIVNGDEVTFEDRDYFHKIQLLWHYGPDSEKYLERCNNLEKHESRSGNISEEYEVTGWIGTVDTYSDLEDDDEDLNKISVMMRGKLAQEDILEDTNIGGLFSKYVIGVIHADFLDADDEPDIATSSRESLKKEEERYKLLKEFIEEELKHIGKEWNEFRDEEGEREAREIPAIDEWFESLDGDNKERARELFGTINQMTIDSEADKRRIFKHSVLAFESLRYRDDLDKLDRISPENVEQLTEIFSDLDDIEASLYHQIVSQRLDVIEELQSKIDEEALDDVLQNYIHEHPWLLDPSWERATGANETEREVRELFRKADRELDPEEREGRIEVKYLRTTGQHVIIDLRDANSQFSLGDLVSQLSRYRRVLKGVLDDIGRPEEDIEIVSVVGQDLEEWEEGSERTETEDILGSINARVLKYDELLDEAANSYERYMDEREEVDRIQKIVDSIDAGDVF